MKCKYCGKFFTEHDEGNCPFCGRNVIEIEYVNSRTPTRIQTTMTIQEKIKTILVLILAIIAVVSAILLFKPDKFGASRISTLKYIPIEIAVENKEYDKAYKLLNDMAVGYDDYDIHLRYYNYFTACKIFDDGRYKNAYELFENIRGFRDVDSYFEREEYEYIALDGIWYMIDSQINADFTMSISGNKMVMTLTGYNYYDYETDTINYTLEKQGEKYMMRRSDGQSSYYLTFFVSKLEMREADTGLLVGTFVSETYE